MRSQFRSEIDRLRGRMLSAGAPLRRFAVLLGACALLALVHLSGALTPLDNALHTARLELVQRDPTGSIVVVEIDEASLRAAGEWPWPRERFATVILNLHRAGAGLTGFDVDFSSRSNSANDGALQSALDAQPGSIVLPAFLRSGSNEETQPLASIARNAVVAGVNVELDPDGRVRRYWRGFQLSERYRPAIASVMATAPYGATTPFVLDYGIRVSGIDHISFQAIYSGQFDPARVRGKHILIGATAIELGDRFATPLNPSLPGVFVHALAYESLVQGRALLAPNQFLLLAAGFCAMFATWPRRGRLNLRDLFIRQGAVLSVVLLLPLLLQALAPVSASLGLALFGQAISLAVGVSRELKRRAEEIVQEREAHLAYVALHDPETELPNRRAMLEHIAHELQPPRGAEEVVAVLVVGIERFPVLRGAIGYANANRVMQRLAGQVAASCGQPQAFHISTSTLGVTLTADSEDSGRRACASALRTLATTVELDSSRIETQTRAGAAFSPVALATPEKLLEQATIALDQARLGNHRFLAFADDPAASPQLQLALVSDVSKGIESGQFRVLYQAKIEARGGAIIGAEALVRWRHPVHGAISPAVFVPVAEETGAIDDLTRWIVRQSIADQRTLRNQGVDIRLSINVSGRSLCDADFCQDVIDEISRAGAEICFEVTETAVIADPQMAIEAIQKFKAAGIRISIDDYGSGLSSLAYLKQLDADELKLDRSLVSNLATSARDQLILSSTINLAHALGMSVVAEGVEDEPTRAALAVLGCDAFQGFLFLGPATCDELVQRLRSDSGALHLRATG